MRNLIECYGMLDDVIEVMFEDGLPEQHVRDLENIKRELAEVMCNLLQG